MAGHTGIYATSAECIGKMGDNYNSTQVIEARINEFCLMAEATINIVARHVFATVLAGYTALPAGGKCLLADIESSMVAIYGLNYKPSGEDGSMVRIEFEDRINILRDSVLRGLSLLRDQKVVTFIVNGA